MFPVDPKSMKILVEEHERELLDEVEADNLAEGKAPADEYDADEYKPVTDTDKEVVPTRRPNKHIHGDKA